MIDMKRKLMTVGIVLLFVITTFFSTVNAKLIEARNESSLISSDSVPRVKGVILRAYVIGDATGGKQVGRVALIDFTKVEFRTFRLFPPGFGYVNYENVSVIIIGLKTEISDGFFHLDTKINKNKVSSIIIR